MMEGRSVPKEAWVFKERHGWRTAGRGGRGVSRNGERFREGMGGIATAKDG